MSYEVLMAHPYYLLLNLIQYQEDIILIDNDVIFPIMDHIVLTCKITNIQLYDVHRKNYCRMLVLHVGKPHMGNPSYLIVPAYTLEYQDHVPEILRA